MKTAGTHDIFDFINVRFLLGFQDSFFNSKNIVQTTGLSSSFESLVSSGTSSANAPAFAHTLIPPRLISLCLVKKKE